MGKTIDWNEAAKGLKRDVDAHGGFLTMQKDKFRDRFGISRLKRYNTEELLDVLSKHGMTVVPHPYYGEGASLRIYNIETEIGRIAQAVAHPQDVPETALIDAVNLIERVTAGKRRRSDCVPWLSALDIFLHYVAVAVLWRSTRFPVRQSGIALKLLNWIPHNLDWCRPCRTSPMPSAMGYVDFGRVNDHGPLRRYERLFLQGVEGHVLSQELAGPADAPFLRRAFSCR